MITKPLIIGQAPARGNDGKLPFAGKSGARLARLAGVGDSGDDLPEWFDLENLLMNYPGRASGKGDLFDAGLARTRGRMLMFELKQQPRRRILMMGKKVRRAMGVNQSQGYLKWFDYLHHRAVVFPHPSGVNRWWNDPVNEAMAELFLRRLIGEPT